MARPTKSNPTGAQNSPETGPKSVSQFKPNEDQRKWLKSALDPQVAPTITAISNDCGVPRKYWYRWNKKEAFKKWWSKVWNEGMASMESYFDKVGIIRAVKDYKYWEAMQMKYFKFAKKEDKNFNIQDIKKTMSSLRDIIQGNDEDTEDNK